MRRLLSVSLAAVVCAGAAAAPARALTIEAPAALFAGADTTVAVSGAAPYDAKVYLGAHPGTACDDEQVTDWERAAGPFRQPFEITMPAAGPAVLCARLVDTTQAGGDVVIDRAAVALMLPQPFIGLTLEAVHPVVGTDQEIRVRVTGESQTESILWAWARPLEGAPCSEIPWVGDKTYWGEVQGPVHRLERLDRITVPGTYRVCAQVANWAFQPTPWTTVETAVTVSQACTDARRSRARRTLSYRRARAAYRRARGARRSRARRVMVRRKAAMNRARARVGSAC